MIWNVAQAKQRLSELIREAAREPQVIYSRNAPVAAVIAAEELPEYEAWRRSRSLPPTLAEAFERLRELAAGNPDPIPEHDRFAVMRANAFDTVLAEQQDDGEAGDDATR